MRLLLLALVYCGADEPRVTVPPRAWNLCYFNCNRTADPPNGVHNWVGTRWALEAYDPELYKLIDSAFRTKWRWGSPGPDHRIS